MCAGTSGLHRARSHSATVEYHAGTGRIYRHVRNHDDARAARGLDSCHICMSVINRATIAQPKRSPRRSNHLHRPPIRPLVDLGPAGPAQVDSAMFLSILQCKLQGTAVGIIGYMDVRAHPMSWRWDCTARGQWTQRGVSWMPT